MDSRFIRRLRLRRHAIAVGLTRFSHRFSTVLNPLGSVLGWLSVVAAVACLVAMTVYVGFDHRSQDLRLLMHVIRMSQATFLITLLFRLVFDFRRYCAGRDTLGRCVDLILLLTLLPLLYPHPARPWIPWLSTVVYSRVTLFVILGGYSAVQLCYALMRLPGKRTNPSLLLTVSFLVFIFLGTLALMLPKCTVGGITFVNALFVSTSAVCITGLTPVDIAVTFTPLGLAVLGVLIEIGALGVMTFTCFFAMFFTGNQSIFSQLLMRDVIYSKSMNSLFPTLLYILGFTVVTEALGAVALYFSLPDTIALSVPDRVMFAVFHSVSAFCNAGFSNLPDGMSNPALLTGNQAIYWSMSAIIVAGAISFPILVNFRDALAAKFSALTGRIMRRRRAVNFHLFDMNTKVVLVTFTLLFLLGAVGFYLLEAHNTLRGMTLWERISQSVFNSVTPRSAGFASVSPASFLSVTLVMVMFLMWVGGAAQSTAGGIKVNSLAAICLNLRAIVTGRERVTAFHRTVAGASIRRANAVVAVSIIALFAYSMLMLILEPELPARKVLFETLSALFTVGSSLGATPLLSPSGKIVLCSAMLFGRVGILSLVAGLTGTSRKALVHYPTDNIIIN
ncbi:MAG: potassium transporter [Bacteroidales bacterium]|nr:potassium transporter [Bacteroidales bacterium]MBD5377251.1 potassium transporter [Bacteroides sp.]